MEKFGIADLVYILDVSRQTINNYLRSGKLPAKKIKGRIVVSEADLKQFHLNCKIQPRNK